MKRLLLLWVVSLVLVSMASFAAAELVLPTTNRISNQDFNVIKGRPPQTASLFERRWLLGVSVHGAMGPAPHRCRPMQPIHSPPRDRALTRRC